MKKLINNARREELLQYLDATLSKPEQVALLGVAGGLDSSELCARLPGLANKERRTAVFASLLEKHLIIRSHRGRLIVGLLERVTPMTDVQRKRALRRTNLQRTLDFLAGDGSLCVVHRLSGMAQVLDGSERKLLGEIAHNLDRTAAEDKERAKRMKRGWLAFGRRLVPRSYLDGDKQSPVPAPIDVLARMQTILLEGITPAAERAAHADAVRELYQAVWRRGEVPLAHLWRLVKDVDKRHLDPADRWEHVCCRMAAYLMPRGLPDLLARYREDPKRLQREYPVPAYGYGAWVDEEMKLRKKFWDFWVPALGPARTRLLWAEAHEAAEAEMQRLYAAAGAEVERQSPTDETKPKPQSPGSVYVSSYFENTRYRPYFERAARKHSGLSPEVLDALPRRTHAVKQARNKAEREWEAYEERRFLRGVIRHAQDDAPGLKRPQRDDNGRRSSRDLLTPERTINVEAEWAPRLLRLELRRQLGRHDHPHAYECALEKARLALSAKRKRKRGPKLAESARRGMGVLENITIRAARGAFPAGMVARTITRVLECCAEQAEKWNQPLDHAFHAVAEGLVLRRLFSVAQREGGTELLSLEEAAAACGDPTAVYRVWEASGLIGRLGAKAFADAYPMQIVPTDLPKAA